MPARHHLLFVLLLLVASRAALAQHASIKNAAEPMPPLMEGLGSAEMKISTADPMAQAYFNRGLRLLFAFNHDEAVQAFRAAETIDPDCAMAQWGIAVALGPNYNMQADPERAEMTFAAVRKARQLARDASPQEQAYIAAMSTRYSEDPEADRGELDRAYAGAMSKLSAMYPDDLNAAVLSAESRMQLRPWDLWTADGGTPLPGTEDIIATLESVLQRDPTHTGANHYHIHACEASRHPERALASAKRLGTLAPGAGHLVHMPSHIFFRLGMYEEAVESNRRAVEVDEAYIAQRQPTGAYPMMYYPHNIHFLWAALAMEGRSRDSIAAATRIAEKLTPEMAQEMAIVEYFLPVRWYALVRFQKWDEMLAVAGPPEELGYARGMWHYARGKSFAGKKMAAEAAEELAALEKCLAETPQDAVLMRHSTPRLLAIAQHDLSASLLAQSGSLDAAISQLRGAVLLQDQLLYDEPPAWFYSEREALARTLLAVDRAAEAEDVLREDLKRSPHNGWSLFWLERALRAQDRATEADQVQSEFKAAWARADMPLQ